MASERNTAERESSSSTISSTRGEDSSAPSVVNTFANDGSFLELFKKRMEAESQKIKPTQESVREDDDETKVGADCDEKQSEKKVLGPSKTLTQQVWFSEKENAKIFPFCWER